MPSQVHGNALKDVVEECGGILVNFEGSELVLDRYGCRALRLGDTGGERPSPEAVRAFLRENSRLPFFHSLVQLHVLHRALSQSVDLLALNGLLRAFREGVQIELTVFCEDPRASLEDILTFFEELRRWRPTMPSLRLSLVGPFETFSPETLEALFQYGVSPQTVHGWWPGCGVADYCTVKERLLNELSEFGLCAPALWYVHAQNVGEIPRLVERSLKANRYSGFSVVPPVQSTLATGDVDVPPLTTPDDYTNLLIDLYRIYPHYDETFAPLSELALFYQGGAWNEAEDLPKSLRLLFRGDGMVGCFRQIPRLAQPWIGCAALADKSADEIRESLVAFYHRAFSWSDHTYCGRCDWRFLCGGVDLVDSGPVEGRDLDSSSLICEHRMVFLEAFTHQRLRAGVVTFSTPSEDPSA